jgi:hypothetical protein
VSFRIYMSEAGPGSTSAVGPDRGGLRQDVEAEDRHSQGEQQ